MSVNFKQFGKMKWKRVWARRILFFLGAGFQKVFLKHEPFTSARHKMYVPEGNLYAFCIAEPEFNELVKLYTSKMMKANLAVYARKYESEFAYFLRFAEKFSKQDFAKMSSEKLASAVKELDERITDFYEFQFFPFLILEGLGREVETKLAVQPDGEAILQFISEPYKVTKINQAHQELLKLAKSISKSKIKKYAQEYGWIAVYDYPDEPWTEAEVRHQLKQIKKPPEELRHTELSRKKHLSAYKKYLNGISDPVWKGKVEIVHYFSYLKEMRDDYRRKAYALVRPVWNEVSSRLGVSVLDINYLVGYELVAILEGKQKLSKSEIKARKTCGALASVDGQVEVFTGTKAKKLAGFVLGSDSKEVTGKIAYPGVVQGKVKIIYHRAEFGKLKQGDILVTTMTHPEFLPIMKKAKAIVTDEGGMLCHAAITSREMKKPCIIGTNIATKILKDGDKVEVDANKGIVRKI